MILENLYRRYYTRLQSFGLRLASLKILKPVCRQVDLDVLVS